jgi:hypothetical protein
MIDLKTTLTGVAATQKRITDWRLRLPRAIDMQMRRQAHRLRTMMVRGIRDQAPGGEAFQPLAETTKKMKKSSKALIDNGDLIRSIGVDRVEGGEGYFIGVNRQAQDDEGEPIVDLAELHEKGSAPYKIEVTPKMRRFWWAMFFKGIFDSPLSPKTKVIAHPGVPPRPFLEPSLKEWSKDVERQFSEGLASALGVKGFVV